MKKLILVLAILLVASPVWAVLDVNLVLVDSDTVAVVYTGADTANLPRAFALTVAINGTGTLDAVDTFKTGESTASSPGFGIYPARIVIDSTGTVSDYGNPLADPCAVGTTDQILPSNSIVLEFGSLYYGDANAPATSGELCRLDFTKGTATQITLVDETTFRGGIVLENGTQTTDTFTYTIAVDECMKNTIGQKYTNWDAAGKPDCWCFKWQGYGDLDGKEEGTGIGIKRIGAVDLGIFKLYYGKKRNVLNGTAGICADIDHLDEGTGIGIKAVGAVDLGIFKTWYGKKTSALPEPPAYAADFNFWKTAP